MIGILVGFSEIKDVKFTVLKITKTTLAKQSTLLFHVNVPSCNLRTFLTTPSLHPLSSHVFYFISPSNGNVKSSTLGRVAQALSRQFT